jgi:hypothetical protein
VAHDWDGTVIASFRPDGQDYGPGGGRAGPRA